MVFTRESRGGIRSARNTRNIDPIKPREEEEAVFIRDSVTNEDPPNAHQAQHPPVEATGAMTTLPQYMPSLQRCCSVHPDHLVDTCQGAVNLLNGAEPSEALCRLRGRGSCSVCDCDSTVDVMIKCILWMTRQYRVKKNE